MDPSPDPAATEDGYLYLIGQVDRLLGIDLSAYKRTQMERRLLALARRGGAQDLFAYAQRLAQEPVERDRFLATFTINVSEFFRDEKPFGVLEDEVLPALLAERQSLKIWSAGCAGGAEPYSLAILLDEQRPGTHYLLGTDVDETALRRARAGGPYTEGEVAGLSAARRARHLRASGDQWWASAELRSKVMLAQHDLLRDPYEDAFDLIVCRNVVIYLTRAAKDRLFRNLTRALRPGGYLFMGGTEMIFTPQEFDLERRGVGFYERRGAA